MLRYGTPKGESRGDTVKASIKTWKTANSAESMGRLLVTEQKQGRFMLVSVPKLLTKVPSYRLMKSLVTLVSVFLSLCDKFGSRYLHG